MAPEANRQLQIQHGYKESRGSNLYFELLQKTSLVRMRFVYFYTFAYKSEIPTAHIEFGPPVNSSVLYIFVPKWLERPLT